MNNKTKGVNPKWQSKLTNGYYNNPMYDYVKATIHDKIRKEGIRDINTLYSVYSQELYEYGDKVLKWKPERIQNDIEKYGFHCLDFWIGIYKLI